jgi:hypothetical protein
MEINAVFFACWAAFLFNPFTVECQLSKEKSVNSDFYHNFQNCLFQFSFEFEWFLLILVGHMDKKSERVGSIKFTLRANLLTIKKNM